MVCEHKHAYSDLVSASASDSVVMKSAVILWAVQQVNGFTAACIRRRNSNPRPREEEQRTNRNVERTHTVSAEPLAVRTHPQENGQGTRSKSGTP